MTETSLFWDGKVLGDHGGYSHNDFMKFYGSVFDADRISKSVLKGQGNELAVTVVESTHVASMATGYAFVDDKLYCNTSIVTFSLSVPSEKDYYYTICIRKDFILQTVRAVLLGPETLNYPAVSQRDGYQWEIPISNIAVDNFGKVTITDVREYAQFCGSKASSGIIWDSFTVKGDILSIGDSSALITLHAGSDYSILQCRSVVSSGSEWVGPIWGEFDLDNLTKHYNSGVNTYIDVDETLHGGENSWIQYLHDSLGRNTTHKCLQVPDDKPGLYMVGAQVRWAVGATGAKIRFIYIGKANNNVFIFGGGKVDHNVTSGSEYQTQFCLNFLPMSGGDQVYFYVQQKSGSYVKLSSFRAFIYRIR